MKFLRQLFGRDSNPAVLAAPINGEPCRVLAAQAIGSNAQLHVATGQAALIFNGERHSALYPTGEHRLEAQDMRGIVDGGEANVLFLQITPPFKRTWQTVYRPGNAQPFILSGQYTAAIEDAQRLAATLLEGGNLPDSRLIDGWLHQYARKILNDQRISAQDVRQHTDRLAVFLHDALIPFLLDHGIRLQNFSLQAETPDAHAEAPGGTPAPAPAPAAEKLRIPPQQFPARTAPAMTPSLALQAALAAGKPQPEAPAAEPPAQEAAPADSADGETESTLFQALANSAPPKIFYRLEKGEQVGPYNIDELNLLIAEGRLRRNDLIWHQGLKGWQRAGEFSGLQW